MDYRIVEVAKVQYFIKSGDQFKVSGILGEPGTNLNIETLLVSQNGQLTIGEPYCQTQTAVTVVAKVQSPKIRVATYKAKSRYRKVKGHRQWQTLLSYDSPPEVAKPVPAKTKKTK